MSRRALYTLFLIDLKLYLRNPTAILMTFFFPVMLLSLLMLSFDQDRSGVRIKIDLIDRDVTLASQDLARAITDALRELPGLEVDLETVGDPGTSATARIQLLIPKGFGIGLPDRRATGGRWRLPGRRS